MGNLGHTMKPLSFFFIVVSMFNSCYQKKIVGTYGPNAHPLCNGDKHIVPIGPHESFERPKLGADIKGYDTTTWQLRGTHSHETNHIKSWVGHNFAYFWTLDILGGGVLSRSSPSFVRILGFGDTVNKTYSEEARENSLYVGNWMAYAEERGCFLRCCSSKAIIMFHFGPYCEQNFLVDM
jgi:hypothetical protein